MDNHSDCRKISPNCRMNERLEIRIDLFWLWTFLRRIYQSLYHTGVMATRTAMGTSQWEVLHMHALIGANDHSGEPQDWKKWPQYLEKKVRRKESPIFLVQITVLEQCFAQWSVLGVEWHDRWTLVPNPTLPTLSSLWTSALRSLVPRLQDLCPLFILLTRQADAVFASLTQGTTWNSLIDIISIRLVRVGKGSGHRRCLGC